MKVLTIEKQYIDWEAHDVVTSNVEVIIPSMKSRDNVLAGLNSTAPKGTTYRNSDKNGSTVPDLFLTRERIASALRNAIIEDLGGKDKANEVAVDTLLTYAIAALEDGCLLKREKASK